MGRDPTARERSTVVGIVARLCHCTVPAYHVVRGTHGVKPVYVLPEGEVLEATTRNWYSEAFTRSASYLLEVQQPPVVALRDALSLRKQTPTVDELSVGLSLPGAEGRLDGAVTALQTATQSHQSRWSNAPSCFDTEIGRGRQ
jgi:hypothetical protein